MKMNFRKSSIGITLLWTLLGCGGGDSETKVISRPVSNPSEMSKSTLIYYGNESKQYGELRLPPQVNGGLAPIVVIIHGGCWQSSLADLRLMDSLADAVTALGYATWNIEYRAIGTGGEWPVIFKDVNQAFNQVRVIAERYPVDMNKIAVIGHSAGGHLALWAASRQVIPGENELAAKDALPIKGVLSLAGIANLTSDTGCDRNASNIIGLPINIPSDALTQRLKVTSPFQMLPSKSKSVIISGSVDTIVPSSIGAEYTSRAISLGDDSSHFVLRGLGHFDLIDPKKTDFNLYKEKLNEIFK
jgi:acetyl esterase/lipase